MPFTAMTNANFPITSSLAHSFATSCATLQTQGWWTGKLLDDTLLASLQADLLALLGQGQFSEAAIGASHNKLVRQAIRGDQTFWLDGSSPIQSDYLALTSQLANELEQYFPARLQNFAGHYSCYPPGTHYLKHLDNARHTNHRLFSMITYFNQGWRPGDGGELCLYDNDGHTLAEIAPIYGQTVLFASPDFPHEVKTTHRNRYSLAGWFHQQH